MTSLAPFFNCPRMPHLRQVTVLGEEIHKAAESVGIVGRGHAPLKLFEEVASGVLDAASSIGEDNVEG
jgi:hypothetical protein